MIMFVATPMQLGVALAQELESLEVDARRLWLILCETLVLGAGVSPRAAPCFVEP